MAEEKKRPTGLIQNQRIVPQQSSEDTKIQKVNRVPEASKKAQVQKNQDANIKVSRQTKNEIDILMKLTDNKFAYEMIESLIDNYVDTVLDNDKKRAFKTLSNL